MAARLVKLAESATLWPMLIATEDAMHTPIEPLVRDLVQWCAKEPKSYGEVLDVWRTSCPRLMVWEEAVARGLVHTRQDDSGPGLIVDVTPLGRSYIELPSARPAPPTPAPLKRTG